MEKLFSYGNLQPLNEPLATSGNTEHPILRLTGSNPADRVSGTVYEINAAEHTS
jgi:hypothetical protein